MSLTGAMLATLQQQWARRYLRMTQPPRSSPHERARMREFFANGVVKLRFARVVEAVPTLIHISLFLFFIGLLIYLFNTNNTVFIAVAWWIVVSAAIYVLIAFMPILRLDTPYRAPLSSPVCRASAGILCLAFGILGFFTFFKDAARKRLYEKSNYYRKWVLRGMKKITTKTIEQSSLEIDGRILKWTFNALGEDHELDRFFQRILDFCRSTVVNKPQRILHNLGEWELSMALVRFLERTWLSNLVSDSEKKRRFVMCAKVVDAACLHDAAWWIHNATFEGDWYRVLRSVEMGHSLRWRGIRGDQEIGLFAQSVVSQTIADVRRNNESWVALATNQLGGALPRYLQHGNDSVLFANLIHITRQIFGFSSGDNSKMAIKISDCILPSLPRFEVQNTLPELQHEFCALWNNIVSDVQARNDLPSTIGILTGIRHIYLDLHQGTGSAPTAFGPSTDNTHPRLYEPSSYPLCTEHHSLVGGGTAGRQAHNAATAIPSPGSNPTHTSAHPTAESSSSSVPNAPASPNPVSTSSHPISLNVNIPLEVPHDIATDGATEGVTDIPSLTNPTVQSNLSGGAALQPNEETTIVSFAMAPTSLLSPPLMPAPGSAATGGPNIPTQPELLRNPAIQDYHSSDHSATRES